MNNVTEKTNEKVQRWIAAKRRLAHANAEVNAAECELANSMNQLGTWLVPSDQPDEEVFCIWFGSGVLQAKRRKGSQNYEVSWRVEPQDSKERMEFGI